MGAGDSESVPSALPNILERLETGASVLVLRLRSLGDAVLTTPALELLRRARPDLEVWAALDEPLAELYQDHPALAGVIPMRRGDLPAMVRSARAVRPRLCLNFHGGSSSAWTALLSGARWRAGFGHYRRGFVYNVKIPRAQEILGRPSNAPVHTAEHLASAVFHLGAPVAEIPRASLAAGPPPFRGSYAVLHIAAAYETKRWDEGRFLSVARHVEYRHGLEPVFLAGPGEDHLLAAFPKHRRMYGLGAAELKSLLAGARLFVGNDSGPAHVAAAFGVPSAVIFGSSNSAVWRPWKTPHEVIETSWDCKPCPGDRCYAFDQPRCILSVSVEAVVAAVDRLLALDR